MSLIKIDGGGESFDLPSNEHRSSLVRTDQLDSEVKVGEGDCPSPRDNCFFRSRFLFSWSEDGHKTCMSL